MFSVNGNPILTDEIEILEELKRQCELNGNYFFRVFRPSGNNIMTTCPFHKDGQERRPSFGISVTNMMCHCFTCGWAGTLDQMISNVFGKDDDGHFGKTWLSKNFLTVSIQTRKPLELNMSRRNYNKPEKTNEGFTEEELDSYRYYHPYMYERGLTDEIIEEFDIGYDYRTECITFPIYHLNKDPAFIARRSVVRKFFNYPAGALKPVYCGERFTDGTFSEAIICESILNTLTCWKYGRPSMALIGTGTSYQYEILRKLPVRKYIIATDPDEAGQRAAQALKDNLSSSKIITFLDIPEGYDINDLQEQFLTLNEHF